MNVVFDPRIAVVGLGVSPWSRLGPERWLERYAIASLYDWEMSGAAGAPLVSSLVGDYAYSSAYMGTDSLLKTPEFQRILAGLPEYDCLPYKAVPVPPALRQRRFLANDTSLTRQIENKAQFRRMFHGVLPFPDYFIVERSRITPDAKGLEIVLRGRSSAIIQDEQISGGRGTFCIRTESDLAAALAAIEQLACGTHLVVSDLIADGHERSVQCCATRYGTFVGPLQKQIVGDPRLANVHAAKAERFCGGEMGGADRFAGAYTEIRRCALAIGARLAEMGFKGIFGLDCLVTESGDVRVLEVNPRITGMTPLVTALYRDERDIPFYLLHVLELGGYEYHIEDMAAAEPQTGSMLVMHSLQPAPTQVTSAPLSGLYSLPDLQYMESALYFDQAQDTPQLLVQRYAPEGTLVNAGGKLLTVFLNRDIMDQYDRLRLSAKEVIDKLRKHISVVPHEEY